MGPSLPNKFETDKTYQSFSSPSDGHADQGQGAGVPGDVHLLQGGPLPHRGHDHQGGGIEDHQGMGPGKESRGQKVEFAVVHHIP